MAISLEEFDASSYELHAAAELRLLYQLYEEAQRGRIAHGERLRAIRAAKPLFLHGHFRARCRQKTIDALARPPDVEVPDNVVLAPALS